ncbi:asparagine synthase-related protein [Streptomyces sp. LZ34]
MLVGEFLGFSGRVDFDVAEGDVELARLPFGSRGIPPAPHHAVQRLATRAVRRPAETGPGEYLLLSGPVNPPVTEGWERRIADLVREGRHAELARLPGELCGALVSARKVMLFRNLASTEGLLYRRDGSVVRWSTDPADLLDQEREEFNRQAIWRCCRGDEVFIYHGLTPVRPGELVIADRNALSTVRFDTLTPLELPRRTPLAQYAELAYDMLLREARGYVGAGRVGVMVSGGLDSAAVLCALVEAGADVVAYHHVVDDPLADESEYARTICDHLSVPLDMVKAGYDSGFPPRERSFSHPFLNVGFPWLEQLAERVHGDGISFLVWGRDGDLRFGPLRYGLHDALTGDIPFRERAGLCAGLLSSRWELPRIARTASRSHSLFDEAHSGSGVARATDFLEPVPGVPDDPFADIPAEDDYSVKDACANLTSWRPRGIMMCNPLGSRDLRSLAARMPDAYRMIPYQGQVITKPVLRLLLSTRLPASVWRRYGRLWMSSAHKNRALGDAGAFHELMGGQHSRLVRMGVVNPERLAEVLADPHRRRRNAETLVHAAMTEIFLRHYKGRTP